MTKEDVFVETKLSRPGMFSTSPAKLENSLREVKSGMTRRNLLERLRGIDFLLLAPNQSPLRPPLAKVLVSPQLHRSWLGKIRHLRDANGVQHQPEVLPARTIDRRDELAWHILAVREESSLLGAIRARIYDCRTACPRAEELFAYSEVEISDPAARSTLEIALTAHMSEQARSSFLKSAASWLCRDTKGLPWLRP